MYTALQHTLQPSWAEISCGTSSAVLYLLLPSVALRKPKPSLNRTVAGVNIYNRKWTQFFTSHQSENPFEADSWINRSLINRTFIHVAPYENYPKYRIWPYYRTYPYKPTFKQVRSLQITGSVFSVYFFIKTHLNCINKFIISPWKHTWTYFGGEIRKISIFFLW